MTHLIVDSEGEIELGIGLAVDLAQTCDEPIELELTFPSVGLMKIFSTNLVNSFIINKVSKNNNLQLIFNVPDEDNEY
tara:strand:- start:600 stop:833 length:234 start_codon:yes stop_codon:yes gene_type:complete